MAEDQNVVQLDNTLVKQLLTSVQTLQSDVAAMKSGATGGPNLTQPPPAQPLCRRPTALLVAVAWILPLSDRDPMMEETPSKNLLPVIRMMTMSSHCQRLVMRLWKRPLSRS